jgi:hypothetical protein
MPGTYCPYEHSQYAHKNRANNVKKASCGGNDDDEHDNFSKYPPSERPASHAFVLFLYQLLGEGQVLNR